VGGDHDLGEARPAATPAVPASPMAPRACTGQGPVNEAREGAGVAMHPIVALMSPEPRLEAVDEGSPGHRPVRLHPVLEPVARTLPLLASGAAFDTRPSRAVFLPDTFDAQQGAPAHHARRNATAAPDAGLPR
jgi:hypothetical protein